MPWLALVLGQGFVDLCPQVWIAAVQVVVAGSAPVGGARRMLGVSVSGCYEWPCRPPPVPTGPPRVGDLIIEVPQRSRGTCGSRWLHAELRRGRGVVVGHGAVEVLGRRAVLTGASGRSGRRRTKPDQIAIDLVDRDFVRSRPNQLWLTDITEHPAREGEVYCAVVLDACSRRVVGRRLAHLGSSHESRMHWAGP